MNNFIKLTSNGNGQAINLNANMISGVAEKHDHCIVYCDGKAFEVSEKCSHVFEMISPPKASAKSSSVKDAKE